MINIPLITVRSSSDMSSHRGACLDPSDKCVPFAYWLYSRLVLSALRKGNDPVFHVKAQIPSAHVSTAWVVTCVDGM